MIFRQITHDDLGCASYLIGDEKAGWRPSSTPASTSTCTSSWPTTSACASSTSRDPQPRGSRLGTRQACGAIGATIHVHRDAAPAYEHDAFDDGWELGLGAVTVRALRPGFGTKIAWLARPDQPIVLVGRDDEDGRRAATLAGAVGVRTVAGFLHGGMSREDDGRPVEQIDRLPADRLPAHLESHPGLQILDVRELHEWEAGHIPESTCIPWHDLTEVPETIDPLRPVAVVCATGSRAATPAGLLARRGCSRVIHVAEGGVATWATPGLPLERGRQTAAAENTRIVI